MNLQQEILAVLGTTLVPTYTVLDRIPSRDQIIGSDGEPGKGNGQNWTAASTIARELRALVGAGLVELVRYLDTRGMSFDVAGRRRRAGSRRIGLYRLVTF